MQLNVYSKINYQSMKLKITKNTIKIALNYQLQICVVCKMSGQRTGILCLSTSPTHRSKSSSINHDLFPLNE